MANLAISPAGSRCSSGRSGVAATAKLRFAFGLFSDPSAMLSAARELDAAGISGERMCLVVPSGHSEDAADGTSGGDGAAVGRELQGRPTRIIAAKSATCTQAWIAPLLTRPSFIDPSFADNPGRIRPSDEHDEDASGPVARFSGTAECDHMRTGSESGDSIARWALERPARQLHAFVSNGGGLVVVRLISDSELLHVCSIFLHQGSLSVQTHDFRCLAGCQDKTGKN